MSQAEAARQITRQGRRKKRTDTLNVNLKDKAFLTCQHQGGLASHSFLLSVSRFRTFKTPIT
jgi:hypothetical protein